MVTNDVSLFTRHILRNVIPAAPPRDLQMTWEQSIRPQMSNSFLTVQGASCIARCFSLGKLFHPSAPWFPTPKRRGIQFYFVAAALQVVLERSWWGALAGFPEWGPGAAHPKELELLGSVREATSLSSMKTC